MPPEAGGRLPRGAVLVGAGHQGADGAVGGLALVGLVQALAGRADRLAVKPLEHVDLPRLSDGVDGDTGEARSVGGRYDLRRAESTAIERLDPLELGTKLVVAVVAGAVDPHGVRRAARGHAEHGVLPVLHQLEVGIRRQAPVGQRGAGNAAELLWRGIHGGGFGHVRKSLILPISSAAVPHDDFQPNADELIAKNTRYAERFHDSDLQVAPTRHLAVVACMDSRMDIFQILGLGNGEAHIIRNAGGVITDDVIRSLCLSQRSLGTREIVLLHHTDCGLSKVNESEFRSELEHEVGVKPWWSVEAFTDPYADVRQSMNRLQITPFLPHKDQVRGFVYDVETGRLNEVDADG